MNQTFHILTLLDVSCECLLHCHKGLEWVSNDVWVFTLCIIHRPLLDTLNPFIDDLVLQDSRFYNFDETLFPLLGKHNAFMDEKQKKFNIFS